MWQIEGPTLFFALLATQAIGITAVLVARFGERCAGQRFCQIIFFLLMAVVGLATIAAMKCGTGCGVSCGAMLSLMAVGATLDLGRANQRTAF